VKRGVSLTSASACPIIGTDAVGATLATEIMRVTKQLVANVSAESDMNVLMEKAHREFAEAKHRVSQAAFDQFEAKMRAKVEADLEKKFQAQQRETDQCKQDAEADRNALRHENNELKNELGRTMGIFLKHMEEQSAEEKAELAEHEADLNLQMSEKKRKENEDSR
jgi:chromosome segregation ATPase